MAYTASDAFCAQADVEGLIGRGTFTSTTKPTAQQCLDWMARVAAEVEAKLAENGITYTVTSHGAAFPATPTDAKTFRLKVLAESANAKGAAAIVLEIHDVKDEYGRVPAAMEMKKDYLGLLEAIVTVAEGATLSAVYSDTNTTGLKFLSDTGF